MQTWRKFLILVPLVLVTATGTAQEATEPFTLDQVVRLLESGVDETEIVEQIEHSKADIDMNKAIRPLIRAGASDRLLDAIQKNLFSELVIESPSEGDEVGASVTVRGRSRTFEDKHLWLFVHRKGLAVWWPQLGEVAVEGDGSWKQSAFLGQPQDVGFDFEVLALWVDPQVHSEMESYLIQGERSGRYPGIRLPEGSPKAKVTVKKVDG